MTLTQSYKFAKFGHKNEIFSNIYEIWRSQQIEYANYECNIRQRLERSRDHWFRVTDYKL